EVEILIPQVYIQLEDKEWSWDRQRINLIRNKKTLADAAIDGVVPSKKIPSLDTLFKKSQEALREWKERIGQGKLFIIQRKDLVFPLRPEIVEQLSRTLGDFSTLNRVWSTSNSKTTHTKLTENPEDWYYYHTLYRERRKEWSEIPYVEIGKMITRKEMIVADLGCGEDLLRKEIPNNKVLSFDHVAINKNVTPCDISHLPLKNESVDITVFSLSLMGANYKEYLQEAYRVLKAMGVLLIAEPITKWEAREEELSLLLTEIGFKTSTLNKTTQFIYVTCIKFKI
ncbi:MAG: methyltransferase domain-containing protein, partial [Leptospiraceae bacterium]|nr:methyltransferase domain-containing protein [Leptospiraceae bacterium]